AFRSRSTPNPRLSLIDGAGVDDRLRRPLAAEDDEQVRDHLRLALLVELDDAVLREALERHLHHADRAVDELLPRSDDRVRLLTLQHRLRDLGRVREMRDARLDDLHPGELAPLLDLLLQVLGDLRSVPAQRSL